MLVIGFVFSDPLRLHCLLEHILLLINHFDEIVYGTLTATNIFQIALTYFVPYCVSTFGSAMQARHIELKNLKENEEMLKN